MKKNTKKISAPQQKLIDEAKRAFDHLDNLMDKHELRAFLVGYNMNGHMIDEDEDITAEQVAILGAYTAVWQLRDKIVAIAEGKKKPEKKPKTSIDVQAIKIKDGKPTEVELKDVPEEVREALKKLIEKEMEDE